MTESPFAEFLAWWLAFLLPAFVVAGPLRRDQGAAHAYLFTVVLHIVVAAIYYYYNDNLNEAFVRGDTNAFHKYALNRQYVTEGSFGIGSTLYKEYLAHVYSFFGPSFFLGAILSVYAYAASAIVLVRFMEVLNLREGKGLVVLLFGGLPTAVLYGTVPMREPYQVLFFMLACYSMLQFRLSSQPLHLIAAIVSAVIMGLLHKGLIVFAPFLIIVMLLVGVEHRGSRAGRWKRAYLPRLAGIALAIGFFVGISGYQDKIADISGTEVLLTATTGEGLVEFTSENRDEEALNKGRTAYGVRLDTSSPVRVVQSSVMILFYYMFTPFPWQIGNFRDLYAFGEAFLRIACLIAVFRMWRRGGPAHPQIVVLLMVVYFSMAFLWSAGTFTWGTATRHHMIHQWILLLLGVPALLDMRASFFGRGHPAAAGNPAGVSGSGEARPQQRSAQRRGLGASPPPLRRLGGEGRQLGDLQMPRAAPRLLAAGLGRPRRLTEP